MSDVEYRPQLATLVKAPPAGDRWVHEIKYDGYRIGCLIDKKGVRLISRNGKDWTHVFPSIAEAAKKLRTSDALIDGEVAMVMPDGRTSFAALQQAAAGSTSHAPLVYFVFDLIRLDGQPLDRLPLEERKARLRALVEPASPKPKARPAAPARHGPHPLRRPRRGRRRHVVRARRRHRTRGHHLQAAGSALSPRSARQLAEVQGHTAWDLRHRRRHGSRRHSGRDRRAAGRLLRRSPGWSSPAASAPASRTPMPSSFASGSTHLRSVSARSIRRSSRDRSDWRIGSRRRSCAKRRSPNGPMTGGCATRCS